MNYICLLIISGLIFLNPSVKLYAQNENDTIITIYDSNGNVIDSSQSNQSYYIKSVKKGQSVFKSVFDLENRKIKEFVEVNGEKNGRYIQYYQTSQTQWIGQYKNDLKTGLWRKFYPTGDLEAKGRFLRNKTYGNWRFYHINGQLAMRQHDKNNRSNGLEISYFQNGQLFSKGKRRDNKRIGDWIWFYDNGQIKMQGLYSKDGYRINTWYYYHPNGQLMCQCSFESNPDFNKYYAGSDSSALYFVEDLIKDSPSRWKNINWEGGFFEGFQTFYYDDGKIASIEKYKDGKLVHMISFNTLGDTVENRINPYGTAFFANYDGDLDDFIEENLQYPQDAREQGIEGDVILNFIVDNKGNLKDFEVLESPSNLLVPEAIRVMKLTNGQWNPGQKHNVPIEQKRGALVRFKLP